MPAPITSSRTPPKRDTDNGLSVPHRVATSSTIRSDRAPGVQREERAKGREKKSRTYQEDEPDAGAGRSTEQRTDNE
jgi:hypothetical protein